MVSPTSFITFSRILGHLSLEVVYPKLLGSPVEEIALISPPGIIQLTNVGIPFPKFCPCSIRLSHNVLNLEVHRVFSPSETQSSSLRA
jgi:hypothetical protein